MVPRKSGSVKDQKSESVTLKTFWLCIQARELFAPDLISKTTQVEEVSRTRSIVCLAVYKFQPKAIE